MCHTCNTHWEFSYTLKKIKEDKCLKQGTGLAVQQAKSDSTKLSQGRKLKPKVITRQFRLDSTFEKCVSLILCGDSVASVAWGTYRILL